jgi:phytoene dehydrogenase-like protein
VATSLQPTKMNPVQADKRPHIGIVGAGVSGLRCADILLSHGFKVTILEARDRIGGRVRRHGRTGGFERK